jgi:hypothetical protein
MIKLLLLFSLFFNIAHATIIAIEDDCHHESAHEYVLEQTQVSDCGDLCDLHHVFHFFAILDISNAHFDISQYNKKHTYTLSRYIPPFKEKSIKPPIA